MTERFGEAMRLMRRADPQKREDGFSLLRSHVAEHVEELIAEFRAEREDRGLRCWLLELIGEARSPLALPLLSELVNDEDESFRYWAVRGLTHLPGKEARQVLWRARANRRID
jgi:HEAT repeat protein